MKLMNRKKYNNINTDKYIYDPTKIYEILSDNSIITAFFNNLDNKIFVDDEVYSYIKKYVECIFIEENNLSKKINNKKITDSKEFEILKQSLKKVNKNNIDLLFDLYIKKVLLKKNYGLLETILSSRSDLELFTNDLGLEEEIKTKIIKLLDDSKILDILTSDFKNIVNSKPSLGKKDIEILNCTILCNYYINKYNINTNTKVPNIDDFSTLMKIYQKSIYNTNENHFSNLRFFKESNIDFKEVIENFEKNGIDPVSEDFLRNFFIMLANVMYVVPQKSSKGYDFDIDNFLYIARTLLSCKEFYKDYSFKDEFLYFRDSYTGLFLNKIINKKDFIDKDEDAATQLQLYSDDEKYVNEYINSYVLPVFNMSDKTIFNNDDFINFANSVIKNNSSLGRIELREILKKSFDNNGITKYINSLGNINYNEVYKNLNEGNYKMVDKAISTTYTTGEVIDEKLAKIILKHHINDEDPLMSKSTIKACLISLTKSSISTPLYSDIYLCLFQPSTFIQRFCYGENNAENNVIFLNSDIFDRFYRYYHNEKIDFSILETVFHEAKHSDSYDDAFGHQYEQLKYLSRNNLLYLKDNILNDEDENYYYENYFDYSDEIFSRKSQIINTYLFLHEINPSIANNYLNENKNMLIQENNRLLNECRIINNSKTRLQEYFDSYILQHPDILKSRRYSLLNVEYESTGERRSILTILDFLSSVVSKKEYQDNKTGVYGCSFMFLSRILFENDNKNDLLYYAEYLSNYKTNDKVILKQVEFIISKLLEKAASLENEDQMMI